MTLEELEIVVKADVHEAVSKLNGLKSQIEGSVNKAVNNVKPNIAQMNQSFGATSRVVASSTNATARQLQILNKQIDIQKRKVKELKQAYIEESNYAKAYAQGGTKNWALPTDKQAKSKYESASITLAKMQLRADQLSEKMGKIGTEAKKSVDKATPSLKKLSEQTQKTTHHTSKLVSMFKRIVIAMAIRGVIRSAIQGFQDLAQASEEFNGTMSNIQASMLQAKNSITTAFAPAIQMLEPYIVKLAEAVSELFTQIAMYTSAFARKQFLL